MKPAAPDRSSLIESIFHAARELSAEQRPIYLDGACREDVGLREEIDGLLECDLDDDPMFVPPPELAGTVSIDSPYREGTMIGRYKLLQQIGEGGFGAVYMAEQTQPVRRKVALKIIKPGMDSKEVIARFEAERQALAMMDHPNIAKVLDAGTTESGRPYFVMELVKGVSITQYCDDSHVVMTERLKLFLHVCRAIQHAHQKGVIHRDLKPSNVMLTMHDGVPIPKVIDFGVSKALSQPLTDKTLFTRYGQIIGTPQYMSPEQAEMSGLDIDTRSDVYSLGVLLYERLTGNTPLELSQLKHAGFEAMRSLIRDSEPTKPSQKLRLMDEKTATSVASHRSTQPLALARSVSGDLDWIVLRSLEKDRNRRYASTHDLARDIERFLDNQPVEAGPPSLGYRTGKFFRRNRLAVSIGSSAVFLFCLAFGLVTAAWLQAIEAKRETDQALVQAQSSQEAASEAAVRAEQEAQRSNDSLQVLTRLIESAKPRGERGADIPVSEFLRHFSRRLEKTTFADKAVEIEVRRTLGMAFDNFSHFDEAASQFDRSLALGRRLYDHGSPEMALFLADHADDIRRSAATKEGHVIDLLSETEEILRRQGKDEALRIRVLTRLGEATIFKREVAEDHLRKACQLTDALSGSERESLTVNPYKDLAALLKSQDKLDEAVSAVDSAVTLARQCDDPGTAVLAKTIMVECLARRRDFEGAETLAEKLVEEARKIGQGPTLSLAIRRRIECEFNRPDAESLQVATRLADVVRKNWPLLEDSRPAWAVGNVAGALYVLDGPEAAVPILELTQRLSEQEQVLVKRLAGQWLRAAGQMEEADKRYAEVFAWRYDKTGMQALWDLIFCERAHTGIRDFEGGIVFLEQVRELGRRSTAKDYWTRHAADLAYALLLEKVGREADSRRIWRDLYTGMNQESERTWGAGTIPILVLAALKSGTARDAWSKKDRDALSELRRGITTNWGQAISLQHAVLGMIDEVDGNVETALTHFEKAVESRQGFFHQFYFEWAIDDAVALMIREEQFDRAEAMLRKDIERRDEQLPRFHPERAFTRLRLAQFLIDTDRNLDGVQDLLSTASEVYDHHGEFLPPAERTRLAVLKLAVAEHLSHQ